MFIIYVIDLSTKNFYKNQKTQTTGKRKKSFFSYFISEIPICSYIRFFLRKCLMFRRSIYLNSTLFRPEIMLCISLDKCLKVKVHKMFRPQTIIYVPTFIYP